MSQETHSPAPWTRTRVPHTKAGAYYQITDAAGGLVGEVLTFRCNTGKSPETQARRRADSALVVVAPDLLASLRTLLDWLHCIRTVEPEDLERDLELARAVIARYVGGAS